jgi:hypothetical protein
MNGSQTLSRKFGLQRSECEVTGTVSRQDKLDKAVADVAFAVKQDYRPCRFRNIFPHIFMMRLERCATHLWLLKPAY